MDLIRELLEASAKVKISKRTAKAVYHRDYEKTKKRPYRKYDPRRHQTNESLDESVCIYQDSAGTGKAPKQVAGPFKSDDVAIEYAQTHNITLDSEQYYIDDAPFAEQPDTEEVTTNVKEGIFDYVKGAGAYVGNKIKQGVANTVAAGQQASSIGNLSSALAKLAQLLSIYDKLKPAVQQNRQSQVPAQKPPAQSSAAQNLPVQPPAQPQEASASTSPQFSSFIQQLDNNDFITEGVWDFVKGAGQHIAQGIAKPFQGAHAAGKQASTTADFESAKVNATQQVKQIVQLLKQMGQGALQQLQQLAGQQCGDQAKRVVTVIQGAAQKMGVQFQ